MIIQVLIEKTNDIRGEINKFEYMFSLCIEM